MGELFGADDDWASDPNVATVDRAWIEQAFMGFSELDVDERDERAFFFLGTEGTVVGETAPDGTFRLDQLATGTWKIRVRSEEHPERTFEGLAETPGREVSGLEFVLENGAALSGHASGVPQGERGELSVRARNCLAKMDIITLGDLVRKTEPELLAYKNFGETSLQEIKDILAQKGLQLGLPVEDDTPLYTATPHENEEQLDALFGGPVPSPMNEPIGGAAVGGADPMDVPIEKLDLSIRARRCMDNLEIATIGDLIRHSENELLSSKNFGQTSLNEVRRKLEAFGLTLKRK